MFFFGENQWFLLHKAFVPTNYQTYSTLFVHQISCQQGSSRITYPGNNVDVNRKTLEIENTTSLIANVLSNQLLNYVYYKKFHGFSVLMVFVLKILAMKQF